MEPGFVFILGFQLIPWRLLLLITAGDRDAQEKKPRRQHRVGSLGLSAARVRPAADRLQYHEPDRDAGSTHVARGARHPARWAPSSTNWPVDMHRALRGQLIALVLVLASCSSAPAGPTALPDGSSAPAHPGAHVFVVVMENREYGTALAQPYTAQLARQYAVATNYHAISRPSLPNYLALTSGATFGVSDDDYHRLPAVGIGDELSRDRVAWRAYMESMTRGCFDSPYPYSLHHNPFAYYGGACPANVVPMTELDTDLASATPSFSWITPNLCSDGHDCSAHQADDFLSDIVPKIQASRVWQQGGLLLITWDENEGSAGNQVPALVIAPNLTRHQTAQPRDHYSLLATAEDRLGVSRLGQTRQATPFNELLP